MDLTISKNSFEGQMPDERVRLLLRRHWIVPVGLVVGFGVLALIPLVLWTLGYPWIARAGATEWSIFATILYLAVLWQGLFYQITMYILDVWIVTNKRIIDSQQHGFFKRSITEASIERIQDITVKVEGPLETFFQFGDIEVETAGAHEKILFKQVPNPEAVKDTILVP